MEKTNTATTTARTLWEVRPTSRAELREDPSLLPWTATRNGEATGNFHTQREAVAFVVPVARAAWRTQGRRSSLRIKRGRAGDKGKRGTVRDERTYGDDPRSSKG